MSRSRLNRHLESQSKRNIVITIIILLVIVIGGLKYGPDLIASFALSLPNSKQKDTSDGSSQQTSFIAPPVLNPLPEATNSATTNISGQTSGDQQVSLYVNNEKVDSTNADGGGKFSFANVTLNKGENTILTKTKTKENKESDFSDPLTITVKTDKPAVSVDSPTDGQSFSKADQTITVKGKTDAGNRVTINDFRAIVDSNGAFTYNFHLQNGDNTLKVVAVDEAGNQSDETTLKVNYSE